MFTDEEPVVGGAAVAERLGVARSTAYRYLQTLVSTRFLEEAPQGGYRLGLRVLEIARVARRGYGLTEVALPVMTDLADKAGETVLLTRRVGELVVCVDRVEAPRGRRAHLLRAREQPADQRRGVGTGATCVAAGGRGAPGAPVR